MVLAHTMGWATVSPSGATVSPSEATSHPASEAADRGSGSMWGCDVALEGSRAVIACGEDG